MGFLMCVNQCTNTASDRFQRVRDGVSLRFIVVAEFSHGL